MGEPGKVGVVTVTYNSADVIDPFLRCLLNQTYAPLNLYVVDNASADATLTQAQLGRPRVKVIRNTQNVGVAEGNNRGIQAALDAGCDYVLLINNDTEFPANLVEKLVNGIVEHDCDMTTPKMVYFDQPARIWAAGGAFVPWLANRSVHYGLDELDHGQFDTARPVQYSPTCCLLVHRRVFETIGLMDANYFVYADDSDFLFRAMRAGLVLYYLPSVTLLHKVGALTGGTGSDFTIFFSTRNKVYFIRKHYSWIRAHFWLTSYQIHLLKRCIFGPDSTKMWLKKQRAFREGLRMRPQAAIPHDRPDNSLKAISHGS